jgi:hypothetical protein
MKKLLRSFSILVAFLAMVAFVGGAVAQETKTATPAPAVEKPMSKKVKTMKVYGTVVTYEAGKIVKVKGAKEKEWTFDVGPNAKIKGEIKEGSRVGVRYMKEGDKLVATSIYLAHSKKAKVKKEEMKEEKK